MTQLNPDKWESFTRSYRMPDGCSKLTLDFLVWQQTGFFEIRNYRLMAPAKKPDTMVVDEYFRKGEFRNNVFSATVPAGWTRFRSGTEPDADCGGITKEFTLVSPQFHSLAVPVPAKGEVGWSNAATPVYRPLRPWDILVQYRPSDDFSGGEPGLPHHLLRQERQTAAEAGRIPPAGEEECRLEHRETRTAGLRVSGRRRIVPGHARRKARRRRTGREALFRARPDQAAGHGRNLRQSPRQ